MIDKIKQFLGITPPPDYGQLIKEGGVILDVRTKDEYAGGHIKGSKNIPLQALGANLDKMKDKHKPVVTCCASGMRSGSAKRLLKSKGYTNVHNGGSWTSLNSKI